jgi:mRNA interferase RelE/StbE
MPSYRIETKAAFERAFDRLPSEIQRRITKRVDGLAEDPRPSGVEKLAGADDLWRARVGDCRVIHQIDDGVLRILLVKVGHRRDVYR